MPVTAKLSKAFYERLGEDIANELVDWFNQVDATYRADLRDLNERNFQRFDARLGERFAEFETRFAEFETRFARLETRFARLETTLERRINAQTRWLFGAWAMLLIPVLGLWFRG